VEYFQSVLTINEGLVGAAEEQHGIAVHEKRRV